MESKFLNERIDIAKELIDKLSSEYEYVSIFGRHARGKRIFVESKITSIGESTSLSDTEAGFVIKVYNNNHYSEYSCDDIKGLDLKRLHQALKVNTKDIKTIDLKKLEDEVHVEDFNRYDEGIMDDKTIVDKLKYYVDYLSNKDSRIVNAFAGYINRIQSSFFITKNKCLSQTYPWNNVMVQVVSADDKGMRDTFKTENEKDTALAFEKMDKRLDEIGDLVLKMLDSKPVEPGVYDIITDPSITGLIAHEAFGHGVEMDMFVKNRAKAKDFIGKQIASKLVSMRDGAGGVLSAASYFFDDDGVMAHDTTIIKDGILQTGISDVLTALELNMPATGNSRRESTRNKAYTRMTNTFFEKGKDKLEDMIKSIKHGYYLCDTNNGMEDPKNWQIQCTAQYGLEIVDGKFSGKIVSPVVISGDVIELLNSITMVSDEFVVTGCGMCGKGHKEWVYVSDGGPHLKARAKLG